MARKPKPQKPRQAECQCCHRISSDLYWHHPRTGRTVQEPFCARCFEDEHRRQIRDETLTLEPKTFHRRVLYTVF